MDILKLINSFLKQENIPVKCLSTRIMWNMNRRGVSQFEAKIDDWYDGIYGRGDTIEEAIQNCLENARNSQIEDDGRFDNIDVFDE